MLRHTNTGGVSVRYVTNFGGKGLGGVAVKREEHGHRVSKWFLLRHLLCEFRG